MSMPEVDQSEGGLEPPILSIVEAALQPNRLGIAAEWTAHGLSLTRGIGGVVLGNSIEKSDEYQTWGNAAIFGALAVTDWVDGKLGRWGRRRQGKNENEPKPFNLNSYVDLFGDKVAVDKVSSSIAKRESLNGNQVYAEVVGRVAGVYAIRDVVTTADRLLAETQGIKTGALPGNKLTATKQYALITAALTPFARSKVIKIGLGAAFAYTAKEKVEGGISMHKYFEEKRSHRRKQPVDLS